MIFFHAWVLSCLHQEQCFYLVGCEVHLQVYVGRVSVSLHFPVFVLVCSMIILIVLFSALIILILSVSLTGKIC